MAEVVIFQHAPHEGPGYFADFLARRRISHSVVRIDRNEPVPSSLAGIRGLVFMGGPMSVNDPLPWIPRETGLIRAAVEADVPVLGHCLGGQLLAKSLGAKVGPNRVREIGWLPVSVIESSIARRWLDDVGPRFEVFHWHGETFELPEGATPLLASRDCKNQGFVIGKHLGLQCHVEMTPAMVRQWVRIGEEDLAEPSRTVQHPRQIRLNLVRRVDAMQRAADALYTQWIKGLA